MVGGVTNAETSRSSRTVSPAIACIHAPRITPSFLDFYASITPAFTLTP